MAQATSSQKSPLTLIVRENDSVRALSFEDEKLVEWATIADDQDVSECNVAFHAGGMFAFADNVSVSVVDSSSLKILHKLPEARVAHLAFSPLGTFLVTFALPDAKRLDGNMTIVNIATGELVLRCVQASWPGIEWTSDESFCVRPVGGVLCVHDGKLEAKEAIEKHDIQLPRDKEFAFAVSPADQPFVVLFKPHHKQSQASCRVFRLPNLKEDIFSMNFGRAEGGTVQWSKSGGLLSLVLKMDTDASGKSYYGTTSLSVLSVRDRTETKIAITSGEAIHDIQWSPVTDEFIVVHGVMPKNKATLYNNKAQPVYSFGEAPRNLVLWAPNGRLFVLGGTGNLAGEFQFYDREAVGKRGDGKLGYFSEKSSVQQWTPDSRYLLCSTVFSRLRIDNKLVVWKHNGDRILEVKYKVLQQASFVPGGVFPDRALSPTRVPTTLERPKSGAYKPPVASAAAAALLARRPASGQQAKPAGPVGATVADPKKKVRR